MYMNIAGWDLVFFLVVVIVAIFVRTTGGCCSGAQFVRFEFD